MPQPTWQRSIHTSSFIVLHPQHVRCALRWWFVLLLVLVAVQKSCDGPTQPVVVIAIPSVPAGVETLIVQVTLDEQQGAPQRLSVQAGDSPRFGITVPAGTSSSLKLQITGTNSNACRSAEGADTIALSGLRLPIERSIALNALSVPRCLVHVAVTAGTGRVQSTPTGIDCSENGGTCSVEVDESNNAILRLTANAPTDSYFIWSGDCIGIGDCVIPLNRARTIDVAFDVRPCDPISNICSYSPLPSGASHATIASVSADDAWAAGQSAGSGSILHFSQGRWHRVAIPSTPPLRDIWAASDSAWAVGDTGTLLRWDGTQFQPMGSGVAETLFGVWGSSDRDVWAVGDLGVILHYDGSTISRLANPLGTVRLSAIWGSGPQDVWAVGSSGSVLHWDGASWQVMVSPSSFVTFVSVFGSGPSDVYVLAGRSAWRWNGSEWSSARQEGTALLHGFARSPNDVWLLRAGGQLLHFDGAAWTRDQVPTTSRQLLALAPAGADGVWVGGSDGEIHLGRGGEWVQRSGHTFSPGLGLLNEIFAVASDNIWACGDYQTLHWDGKVWRAEGPDSMLCGALFGTGADDIWLMSKQGLVLHYDGMQWQRVTTLVDAKVTSGFALSKSLAYAVGSYPGVVYRWNGSSWIKDLGVGTNNDFRSVWASSPSDVWLVLNNGSVERYDGAAWTYAQPAQPPLSFNAVSGRGANQVFLVGDQLTRWNGVAYINDPNPISESLRRVQALPDGTALAISESGAVIRWDGSAWTVLQPSLPGLQQLVAVSANDLWFVGDRSSLWRLQR